MSDREIWEQELEYAVQRFMKYDDDRQAELYETALRTIESLRTCSNCGDTENYCVICGAPR